jgi:uncharacterized coiled-coil DUF342 family protein
MLRGIDSPTDVSESLSISYNTAKSYIQLIQERWTSYSSVDELQAKRQKLIRRTEEVIKEAWVLRDTAKNNLEAVGALRTVLMAVDKLERLQGINTLPLPIEKPKSTQMFELAQKANSLPKPQRAAFLQKVKDELKRRKEASTA